MGGEHSPQDEADSASTAMWIETAGRVWMGDLNVFAFLYACMPCHANKVEFNVIQCTQLQAAPGICRQIRRNNPKCSELCGISSSPESV